MGARLLSLNVGMPRDLAWRGKVVRTGIWKAPVRGPRWARRLNVDGDGQGDLRGHGGEQRAVLVYQMDSYRHWERELSRNDFTFGQFGENLTVEGLADQDVCVGDRYQIGDALFEVTQPRVTCYRVGLRLDEPRMAARMVEGGRPGFYLRVLEEGLVESGVEIVQVGADPERMTVSEINALLYMPGRSRRQLERALRIPALSPGWRGSFRKLLAQEQASDATKKAGKTRAASSWAGFRDVRVTNKSRESGRATSLTLEAADGTSLTLPAPGQYVVLRVPRTAGAARGLRSYSLSGEPSAVNYRISVKREPHGVASGYIDEVVQIGDVLEISAPRGDFTLRPGEGPVVLVSAGIGATPVLAMLHALVWEASRRDIWWLHGARCGREHLFAEEVRSLLGSVASGHRHISYSAPSNEDRLGVDYDASGRLKGQTFHELGIPRDADFFVCGPTAFMTDVTEGLAAWGVAANHIHTESFGPGRSVAPGVIEVARRPPHAPARSSDAGPFVSFARSGLSVRWGADCPSLLELAEACDVPTKFACRTGVCHSCETGLIAGEIGYDPAPLTLPTPGNVLICCSRPHSDVVLDL